MDCVAFPSTSRGRSWYWCGFRHSFFSTLLFCLFRMNDSWSHRFFLCLNWWFIFRTKFSWILWSTTMDCVAFPSTSRGTSWWRYSLACHTMKLAFPCAFIISNSCNLLYIFKSLGCLLDTTETVNLARRKKMKFHNDSASFLMEKLKNHIIFTKKQYFIKKSKRIQNLFIDLRDINCYHHWLFLAKN